MILDPGLIEYSTAYAMQRELVRRRKLKEIEDSLIVCEHPLTFTVGRKGSLKNLLAGEAELKKLGAQVLFIDRGGDITLHAPGQLVMYPIIDLNRRSKDMHKYLRDLEEVVIQLLGRYSLNGARISGKTGVWVNGGKIASIGVAATNWVTYHGLSLNVNTDLDLFSLINPCGFTDLKVTSLEAVLKQRVFVDEVKDRLIKVTLELFKIEGIYAEDAFSMAGLA